jgi:hypothetical protein
MVPRDAMMMQQQSAEPRARRLTAGQIRHGAMPSHPRPRPWDGGRLVGPASVVVTTFLLVR